MPQGWQWDETLFRGSAPYYERGRLPYPPGLATALAAMLGLDGRGRLIDVGCGPGTVALRVAHLVEEVVGLDPDAEMLAEAKRRAAELGIDNIRWVQGRGEDLPAGPGCFRVATFAASFHWMDRERVAAAVFELLEPGGAFVQVSAPPDGVPEPDQSWPHPPPPRDAVAQLLQRYVGTLRRAGQGVLRYGTPGGEAAVLSRAGFDDIEVTQLPGGECFERTVDDLVAAQFSYSGSAPHLFGKRLPQFEADLRALLVESSPSGLFTEQSGDTELRVWRKPHR